MEHRPPFHPLCLNSFRLWRRLKRDCGGVDGRYWWLNGVVSACSAATAPLRALENVLYDRRLGNEPLNHDPVFILGHWRSGTTHLHNLLALNPDFGHVTTYQTLAPELCLVARWWLRPILAMSMPETRPMDAVSISTDSPQEEEYALCNITPHSFYAGLYFPRAMRSLFTKYALFDDITPEEQTAWRRAYLQLLRKAEYMSGGKPLVLKNPVNMGRLPALLEMFPRAKFIHIHRCPYHVYKSTLHFHRVVRDLTGLQMVDEECIERYVIEFFRDLAQRYFEEKHLIPEGRLVDVRFETLEAKPMAVLEEIYERLQLPGWDAAELPVRRYLERNAGYRKNPFKLSQDEIERVEEHWGFAIDAWDYERPTQVREELATPTVT